MSIKVNVDELAEQMERYGDAAFILSAAGESRPHIVQLRLTLVEGNLQTSPGRGCARNVAAQPELSLLWPAVEEGDYSLIVDGVGALSGPDEDPLLTITPTSAVKHRPAP